jgi:hypothetical protein
MNKHHVVQYMQITSIVNDTNEFPGTGIILSFNENLIGDFLLLDCDAVSIIKTDKYRSISILFTLDQTIMNMVKYIQSYTFGAQ